MEEMGQERTRDEYASDASHDRTTIKGFRTGFGIRNRAGESTNLGDRAAADADFASIRLDNTELILRPPDA